MTLHVPLDHGDEHGVVNRIEVTALHQHVTERPLFLRRPPWIAETR